ncbi:MAG: 1,2-phenylacetyl-CoA epoxidase subunit PaaC [Bacteroidota bacterium]
MVKEKLYNYLLLLGDNSMILGHRLSELCGHGPSLETDIALTNISLDLFGQVRHYFQYAAELKSENATEDSIAMLRYPHEYRNTLLVEQPNTDFAYIITRQFLFDHFHLLLLQELMESNDKQLSAIAHKSIKEVRYHVRFSSEWMKRLGDGTERSHEKVQAALDYLWPYVGELLQETPTEAEMKALGVGADLPSLEAAYLSRIKATIEEATLTLPTAPWTQSGGKQGIHTEHFGFILSDLQYMQRTYPEMTW